MKIFLNKKFMGLRIVYKPAKQWKDLDGSPQKTESKYIQFQDGKYETEDKVEIAAIEKYMKDHQSEVTVLDSEELKRREEITKRVEAQMKKEDEEAAARGGDRYGNDLNKEDNVPGEYSDKEIDGANISDKKPEDMNKKELLKCAKELDMKISRKERKDVEVLRQLVIGEFYANAPVESRSGQGPLNVPVEPGTGGVHQGATTPNDQGPDLNDESES